MDKYINRNAVRNALYEADAITMKGVAILNQFPAADVVEVRRGRWIEQQTPSNYCQFCGAKMDGGQDDV